MAKKAGGRLSALEPQNRAGMKKGPGSVAGTAALDRGNRGGGGGPTGKHQPNIREAANTIKSKTGKA